MSKTLNEDFLYYISEEGSYDLMCVCVCARTFLCVCVQERDVWGHLLRIY